MVSWPLEHSTTLLQRALVSAESSLGLCHDYLFLLDNSFFHFTGNTSCHQVIHFIHPCPVTIEYILLKESKTLDTKWLFSMVWACPLPKLPAHYFTQQLKVEPCTHWLALMHAFSKAQVCLTFNCSYWVCTYWNPAWMDFLLAPHGDNIRKKIGWVHVWKWQLKRSIQDTMHRIMIGCILGYYWADLKNLRSHMNSIECTSKWVLEILWVLHYCHKKRSFNGHMCAHSMNTLLRTPLCTGLYTPWGFVHVINFLYHLFSPLEGLCL